MPRYGTRPAPRVSAPPDPGNGAAVPWLLGSILVFAPLFRSGQPALAVLVLELLAVCLLAIILWRPRRDLITRPEAMALILLFGVPLLYLIPLPVGLVEHLPGRGPYLARRALLMGEEGSGLVRLSLAPLETESALLLLLLPVAVFIAVRVLDSHRVLRLVRLLLVLAALQALLGLLQYSATKGSPLLFGMELKFSSGRGTYTNVNHFAGLLAMLLPVALALMVYAIGRHHVTLEGRGWRWHVAFLASLRGHAAFGYGAIALLLLVGIIFTRSRSGIMLTMLALALSMLAFAWRIGGNNVYGLIGTIIALGVGIGIVIGLVPVLDHFSIAGAIEDQRWTIFSATLDGIGAFLPLGSGPGNYPNIFPAFQPLELGPWFINHAHNDYLEWLFEGGLPFAALILLLLMLYARQWTRIWTRDEWSRFRFVQIAAGIGLLVLLLHGLSDFNLHIPANIAYFAFLAGVFFSPPGTGVEAHRPRRRGARQRKGTRPAASVQVKERPATPVRSSERRIGRDLDAGDDRKSAPSTDNPEGGCKVSEGLNPIRKTLTELERHIPRVLLLQWGDEDSDQGTLISELRALGDRLTAYRQTVGRRIDQMSSHPYSLARATPGSPANGELATGRRSGRNDPRRRSNLETLQTDLESVIAAVDAFIDHPGRDDGLSTLDARLRDAEQRCRELADEAAEAPRSRRSHRGDTDTTGHES